MEKVLSATVLIGKIGLCYPLLSSKSWKRNKLRRCLRFNPVKILQALLCIYSVIFALDKWTINSTESLSESKRLSDKIYYFMAYIAMVVADMAIRIRTIHHWDDITSLYPNLVQLWCCTNFVKLKSCTRTKVYVALMYLAAAWDLSTGIFMVYKDNVLDNGSFILQSQSRVAPRIEIVLRAVDGFTDIISGLSLVYAALFLTCFGPILVDAYRLLVTKFMDEFIGHPTVEVPIGTIAGSLEIRMRELDASSENQAGVMDAPVENVVDDVKLGFVNLHSDASARLAMFVAEFERLRNCLTVYCAVAAGYSFALVFRSAVSTILAIVAVAGLGDNSDFIPRADYLLYLGEILAVILLADFGTHMRKQIDTTKEELRRRWNIAATNSEVSRISSWILNWDWSLTACNSFPIGRGLLLGIGETSLAVIIFMFQLRVSENAPSNGTTQEQWTTTATVT